MKFQIKESCGSCPVIYDFHHEGKYIGYLRLRHGALRICTDGDLTTETLYSESNVDGPGGMFESTEQRDHYINLSLTLLAGKLAGTLEWEFVNDPRI